MKTIHITTILFFQFFLFPVVQIKAETKSPKTCLVLKGGGALGFAHVGALKVLEEEHVQIDCIAGTSIGSIVGAAYASGNTVERMERFMIDTDWDALFGEKVEREGLDYRLKPGRNREILGDTKISFRDGKFAMPMGIVEGQNIRILFQELFGNPPVPVDFDSLPVPFRAVTADLEKAETYVPEKGDLARVVRASMSVPGAFSPVEIDGRLLIDGGITDNLPVDVALKMGAERLIVIDLQSKLAKREDLSTPFSISGQMVSMLLMQNAQLSRQLIRSGDVIIEPDVSEFAVTDFNEASKLMAIGEAAARKVLNDIKRFSVPASQYQQYQAKRTGRKEKQVQIDFVRLNNNSSTYKDKRIIKKFDIEPGEAFDQVKVNEAVDELYKTGYFRSVEYSLVNENGKDGIEINTHAREWDQKYVRMGFSVEDDLDGESNFRLAAAYRFADPIFDNGYGEVQAEIGKTPKLQGELYQPLWGSEYFINPLMTYSQSQIYYSRDGDDIAEYQRDSGVGEIYLGRSLYTSGEMAFGVARGFGDVAGQIGDVTLPNFSYDIGELRARLSYDTLDTADFPTRGVSFTLKGTSAFEGLGAQEEFNDISAAISLPYSFGNNTVIIGGQLANTFDDRPVERSFPLGGFLSISGYRQNSIQAADYALGQIVAFRKYSAVQNPLFDIAYYLGSSFELTQAYNDAAGLQDYNLLKSGSVFFGLDTPILPLYAGFGLSNEHERSIYIAIGRIGRTN